MKTPNYWIEYAADWRLAPMAYWVHVEADGKPWARAERFEPPAPAAVPHKGFPIICVEFGEFTLQFSSQAQIAECIRVLSLSPLPTTSRLVALRNPGVGLNSHWLSRLPSGIKSPKNRALCVKTLVAVLSKMSGSANP
ncbi:MAG: hypothetical protein Q7V20_16420 [Aquabacterium sp.]|uniref:hypothetical protein n=1 Tax=Aquabacterium sp. TaxID=1872578 RepID=UPI002726C978|nr:hypothetical protein [Aquabacterium sp.]MDO9005030.1 hypothetical protein [Aquabacterium sp.]